MLATLIATAAAARIHIVPSLRSQDLLLGPEHGMTRAPLISVKELARDLPTRCVVCKWDRPMLRRRPSMWRRIGARLPEIVMAIAVVAVIATAVWVALLFR